jgi:2-polyprenyl-3-methyl-5-hydroxy-6-metoxy-1,4-benzoquinol methylase
MSTAEIAARYRVKLGLDVERFFRGVANVDLLECQATGYRFWRPENVAGSEDFYKMLANLPLDYYRKSRWEYERALKYCTRDARVLEVGCGPGHFLAIAESRVAHAEGVELNREAAANKVTRAPIHTVPLAELASTRSRSFDVVCAFQVVEHLCDPRRFIEECVTLLKPHGRLVLSTPNDASALHRSLEDPLNLPPHHMGHFSTDTYARLAPLCGVHLERSFVSRKRSTVPLRVTERSATSLLFKAARRLAKTALDSAFLLTREPGDNLLVALRGGAD